MTTDNIWNKIDNWENPESLEDIIKWIEKVTQENLELLKKQISIWNDKNETTATGEKASETDENGIETTVTRERTEERIEVNPKILEKEMSKHLKTVSLMSSEEIKEELESYGVEITEKEENNIISLRKLLNEARNTIANEDKNSDIIDFHIGTFTQYEKSKYCAVLAQLDNMTDDEIRDMIEFKEESNSYRIIFPNGDYTDITEEALNSWSVTVDWENRILNDLPKGDKDVKLITMAYVQKFWTYIVDNWERQYKVNNKFREATEPKYMDNQYFEDIQDYTKLSEYWINVVSVLNNDELKRKGFDFIFEPKTDIPRIEDKATKNEAKESAAITTLSNGKNICITATYMYISDWTLIPEDMPWLLGDTMKNLKN